LSSFADSSVKREAHRQALILVKQKENLLTYTDPVNKPEAEKQIAAAREAMREVRKAE